MKAVSDRTPELEPAPNGSSRTGVSRVLGVVVLALFALGTFLTLIVGLGAWTSSRTGAVVPDVTGRAVPAAVERIRGARLITATMGAYATTDYDNGVVIDQLPLGGRSEPMGSPVELLVAVTPTRTVVPDLRLDSIPTAEVRLGNAMLRPVVYTQLSDTVPYGRVVSQMPRAGAVVTTGQQVAIFQSIGRGTGGATVPSVLGRPVSEAATSIADAYLVALLFDAAPGTVPGGRVTDQVPDPGTRVPFGSAVPIFTSTVPQ